MKNRSKPDGALKIEAPREPSLLERLETYFKTIVIKQSIERELDEEVARARKEAQMSAVKALKKRRPGYERSGKKTPKSTKRATSRSLPKVLTMQQKPSELRESPDHLSDIQSMLSNAKVFIRRRLIPNPGDTIWFATANLRKLTDRIAACQKLIQQTSIQEQELRTKAQQARRVADKLNRRAAMQKKSHNLLPKQVAETNRYASRLERSASQYTELLKLRLPILKSCLVRLEDESHKMDILLITTKTQALTEMLKKSDALVNKCGPGSSTTAQVIARMEQRVLEREAKLAEALDNFGCIIELSPTIFEGMERKVAASEELAKASLESIANLPAVETKSMNLEQVKNALASYALASKEISNSYEAFTKIEDPINELIVTWMERKEVWLNRQSTAEIDNNIDLANQGNKRVNSATDTIRQLEQSLEAIRAIKEPIQKRLDEINLVSAKLAERLVEIEQAN
ncbi:hypothetical protein KA344_05950 [bacterium]|jgi:hypothetical protein|nr:hypothetical protein [bacterium]